MLMGVETEYAATAFGASMPEDGWRLAGALLRGVVNRYPYVSDAASNGVFLANGARLYIDAGDHPEYATPECSTPREVIAYIRAGERVLDASVGDVSEYSKDSIGVFRNNVDYIAGTTWGCHESYLHCCEPEQLWSALIPHLVSRVIYSGAGGFVVTGPSIEFTLSPRAWQLAHAVSHTSTEARAIVHSKDEPLTNRPYHRLHLISGESLCSDIGALLKIGTTALIVNAVDAGWAMDAGMDVAWPIPAIRSLARDPTFRARVAMKNGTSLSAIDLQRRYLDSIAACRVTRQLPEWADEVCELWATVLDNLERDPSWAERSLDWGIKLALFRHWLGVDGWQALRLDAARRNELFEIDARFGQLGEGGIFRGLEAQNLLETRVVSESEILRALTHPPAHSRARIRGALIRQMAALGTASDHICDWNAIWHRHNGNFVDLNDPFEGQVRWRSEAEWMMAV